MKYDKIISKIQSGTMSRADLVKLKTNAENKVAAGELNADQVLKAIEKAVPADSYILFMGFCPEATIDNRLDREWKEKGICRFDYKDDPKQTERFQTICKGDLVALKKIQEFGKTMKLFGHGRVSGIAYDEHNTRYLLMDWSDQEEIIEVPLMACNSTVDIKTIEKVEDEMPDAFFTWLGQ